MRPLSHTIGNLCLFQGRQHEHMFGCGRPVVWDFFQVSPKMCFLRISAIWRKIGFLPGFITNRMRFLAFCGITPDIFETRPANFDISASFLHEKSPCRTAAGGGFLCERSSFMTLWSYLEDTFLRFCPPVGGLSHLS